MPHYLAEGLGILFTRLYSGTVIIIACRPCVIYEGSAKHSLLNGYILFLIATVPLYTGRYAILAMNDAKSACLLLLQIFINIFLITKLVISLNNNFITFNLYKPDELAEEIKLIRPVHGIIICIYIHIYIYIYIHIYGCII